VGGDGAAGRTSQQENALVDAGVKVGARPVATLAARMALASGYPTFRLVTAIRTGKTLAELPASLGVGRENHLASAAEVRDRFRDQPGWLANAQALAERCRSDVLPRGSSPLPVKLPHGTDALTHLTNVCDRAMTRLNLSARPAVRRRLAEELNVIGVLGLGAYFLACNDLADEATRQGWPFNLRGSAGASLVLHLLGLTDCEPVSHGLRFERFLNAARERPPDVDVEFAAHQRGKVLSWLIQRHGADHVARAGSYSHLRAVSSLKASLKLTV
jgi:DNA polymerase III alpha subunit